MQTNELYALAKWFEKQIEIKPVLSYYTKLHTSLKNATANPTQANLDNADKIKHAVFDELSERLSLVDESTLTDNQRQVLRDLDLQSILLAQSKDYLHNLLVLPQDYSYILSTLNTVIERLSRTVTSFKQIRTNMELTLRALYLEPIFIPENKCLTRLHFQNDACIDNVVNFKDWGKSWFTIARGFSMAVNQAPEDFEIISADKGSVIVDLMLNIEVVKLITETLTAMAELATQLIAFKMSISAAKELKSKIDKDTYEKMIAQVTEKAEKDEETLIESVVDRLVEKGLVLNKTSSNELTSAIKELAKYNQKGGNIDCISSPENKAISESLNAQYKQLQDKSEVKFIEDKQDKN
ncbi:hypothetical protein AB4511_04490 [Vibrio sp. 10N.222.54.F6]|uniref:hypothetical protein n=1 Tax=unclassified Vibrio TaxID=2614977 RepID=UPI000C832AE6|nr:hypothetical protein [Vibrio sp. 10N.261.51.A7]PML71305.1 hypothetical protein BCT71_11105 [Vibrio sp. 10N.261.51.A7]